jgi:hypothetical protein
VEQLLLELLYRLEVIGDRDESLYDTVVREKMGDAIFFGFVKPQPDYELPDDYGMPDAENGDIKTALAEYINGMHTLAQATGITTFHGRLKAFQNSSVRTAKQKNDFDDFFGWSNPEFFDDDGNVTRLH